MPRERTNVVEFWSLVVCHYFRIFFIECGLTLRDSNLLYHLRHKTDTDKGRFTKRFFLKKTKKNV